MCGIAGIVGSKTPDAEARLNRMSRAVAHRGPDDAGVMTWPESADRSQTAFTHRRLSIIDLSSAGRQPMTTRNGRFTIVFNGEIYNYRALRRQLQKEGVRFGTDTDTEVLLCLYAQRGARSLESLQGMFTFAVRDNETGEVFAARDRLGIKPLYYYAGEGGFLFASEIRALLVSGLIPRVIDPVSLSSYLSFGAVQEPRTIIQDVRTLPPAHCLSVDAKGRINEVTRYWHLPQDKFNGARIEAIAETRRRLEESVELHLVADVPLGAFLSGGIDSCSIVSLMTRRSNQQVETFTVCFDEHEFSERELARQVAEKLGTRHTEIVLSEQDLLASLPQALAAIDQPTIDGINTWVVARATRAAGVTVALSGLGGDELFGGYPSFRRASRVQRFAAPISLLNAGTRRQVANLAMRLMGDSLRSQKAAAAIAAGGDLLSSYASMRGLFSKTTRQALLNSRHHNGCVVERDKDYNIPDETLALIGNGQTNGDVFNRISCYELSLYTANMLLRDTDAMSMAHALEVRVPLLDHKLLEWVYGLPGSMKIGRHPKTLLIEALGKDLPAEVLGQKKMGFALPFERWLRTALKPFVAEALEDARGVARAGLNPIAVADVRNRFGVGARSTSWSRVWGLAVLVDWCRRHKVEVAV
ncbi:MAG: asparagine synthase (glutamine-hydrolyzing) [Pyrinomonadaceae bacterium]|nr:asparagine synthase (glutamine-hydrolyzing) [Pyrinomonadaceae bacterium]